MGYIRGQRRTGQGVLQAGNDLCSPRRDNLRHWNIVAYAASSGCVKRRYPCFSSRHKDLRNGGRLVQLAFPSIIIFFFFTLVAVLGLIPAKINYLERTRLQDVVFEAGPPSNCV